MKVFGQNVTSIHVLNALATLSPTFQFRDLSSAFSKLGFAESDRCADRVLQRLRKLDAVTYSKGLWKFTTSKVVWLD